SVVNDGARPGGERGDEVDEGAEPGAEPVPRLPNRVDRGLEHRGEVGVGGGHPGVVSAESGLLPESAASAAAEGLLGHQIMPICWRSWTSYPGDSPSPTVTTGGVRWRTGPDFCAVRSSIAPRVPRSGDPFPARRSASPWASLRNGVGFVCG